MQVAAGNPESESCMPLRFPESLPKLWLSSAATRMALEFAPMECPNKLNPMVEQDQPRSGSIC
jgi:hypothetical protein